MTDTIYAIGDVHGQSGCMDTLRDLMIADAANRSGDKLAVFLGDYVDRGPDSYGVVDRLMKGDYLPFPYVCLKGNHEDMMVYDLQNTTRGDMWIINGGAETLNSYERTTGKMPPQDHIDWMNNLPTNHVVDHLVFVHAGIIRNRSMSEQTADTMLWIRSGFINDDTVDNFLVIHGHTPAYEPAWRKNRIGIDTGATFRNGYLSCLVIRNKVPVGIMTADKDGKTGYIAAPAGLYS